MTTQTKTTWRNVKLGQILQLKYVENENEWGRFYFDRLSIIIFYSELSKIMAHKPTNL